MRFPAGVAFTGLGPPVVVACSGGSDSLALLALAVEAGLRPVAVHVDHGLRPGGRDEADRVASACERVGARFDSRSVTVEPGSNLEARARRARYAVLERARLAHRAGAVLVGYKRQDQAETMLLQLLRGAGSSGLGAMRPRRGSMVRPLLGVRRSDLSAVCRIRGLVTLDDPMNRDSAYRRVLLRREVLPQLVRSARRDLVPVLARQAELLRDESDYLDDIARAALDAARATPEPGAPELNAPRARVIAELESVVARRVVRVWLGAPPPSADEVERVLAVAAGTARAAELTGARRVERHGGRLYLRVVAGSLGAASRVCFMELPGSVEAWGWRFESWVEREVPVRWPDGRWTCVLDATAAGDRVRLVWGDSGSVVAHADGSELWRVGYRVGAAARVRPTTRRFLWLTADQTDQSAGAATAGGAQLSEVRAARSLVTGASA